MDLQNNYAVRIAVILTCSCWTAQAAPPYPYPSTYQDGYCARGTDCVPKRATYGFTPTKWRQWPGVEKSAGEPAAPENLPTPAKEPPKAEPETPKLPAEDAPLRPTDEDTDSTPPQPPGSLPPASLFDDNPPKPPGEVDGPGPPIRESTEAPGELPSLPQMPAPPSGDPDKPPSMDDDDPFKDDPIPHSEAPAEEPPSRGAVKESPAKYSIHARDRWRGNSTPVKVVATAPQTRSTARDEPRLLRSEPSREIAGLQLPVQIPNVTNPLRGETAGPQRKSVAANLSQENDRVAHLEETSLARMEPDRQLADRSPVMTPGTRNPLRPDAAAAVGQQVVRTAGWVADQEESQASGAPRLNPLRSN